MTPKMCIARQFIIQDGEMESIKISDSSITNVVDIDQGNNTISIPRIYLMDFILIVKHIMEELV